MSDLSERPGGVTVSRWLMIGVGTLVVLCIAVAAYALGRGSGPGDIETVGDPRGTTTLSASATTAEPLAPPTVLEPTTTAAPAPTAPAPTAPPASSPSTETFPLGPSPALVAWSVNYSAFRNDFRGLVEGIDPSGVEDPGAICSQVLDLIARYTPMLVPVEDAILDVNVQSELAGASQAFTACLRGDGSAIEAGNAKVGDARPRIINRLAELGVAYAGPY